MSYQIFKKAEETTKFETLKKTKIGELFTVTST
jgi:hypothetical protein